MSLAVVAVVGLIVNRMVQWRSCSPAVAFDEAPAGAGAITQQPRWPFQGCSTEYLVGGSRLMDAGPVDVTAPLVVAFVLGVVMAAFAWRARARHTADGNGAQRPG